MASRIAIACLLALINTAAMASEAFPAKTIRFVTGAAGGGAADIIARLVAHRMGEAWGSSFVVENRPGAGGSLAAEMIAKLPADGHNVLVGDSSIWAINAHLYSKLGYDPRKSFAPVAQVAILPVFLVVQTSMPVENLAQFLAYVKERPGKLSYASAGNGTIHHLTGELLKSMAGLDLLHVPYKGAAPAGTALLAGNVQTSFFGYPTAEAGVRSGKLRILAINTAERAPALPDVPTFAESGLAGFDTGVAFGMLVPAGTPREVIAKLQSGILAAIDSADARQRFTVAGVIPALAGADDFARIMAAEYEKYGRLVRLSGARVD